MKTSPQKTRHSDTSTTSPSYRISRSKIDLFLTCPKCFYLDRRLGIVPPSNFPFSLNSAVDILLKKEFDSYRAKAEPHPLMAAAGIKAVPYDHPQIGLWRDSLKGGINPDEELIIVDYKATAKAQGVSIDADWQKGYKRQIEIYQWLFRKNGFKVADTGYFLYCNGLIDRAAFNQRLDFDVSLIAYQGSGVWIDDVLKRIDQCLHQEGMPESGRDCLYCQYRIAVGNR